MRVCSAPYDVICPDPKTTKTMRSRFIAHMDTSPDAPGSDIQPAIIHYTGGVNSRSAHEFIPVHALTAMVEVLREPVKA